MSFNSLANLLLADRGDTCVSFTASGNISWKQFLIDVSSLILAINKSSAQSVAICCDNSYLFSVAFFAVIHAQKRVVLPGMLVLALFLFLSFFFSILLVLQ